MNQQLSRHDLAWLVRRLPRHLVETLKKHGPKVVIAGGYIRSCVAGEPVNDIDLFVGSVEQGEALALDLVGDSGKRIHRTQNALTILGGKMPLQVITRWLFDSPAYVVPSFDFTIARAAVWWNGAHWCSLIDENFYPDLAAKRLVYCQPERNEDAGGSMLRVLKFYQRGYRIPLDSLGAVIARLMGGVDADGLAESVVAKIVTGLLREVDPNIDPDHISHLPSQVEEEGEEVSGV